MSGRVSTRYATLLGTITTAVFIALAQAPAVEQARALASQASSAFPLSAEMATIRAAARLGHTISPRTLLKPNVALIRASRSAPRDPRSVARLIMAQKYHWGSGQFSCLDRLWDKESHWNYRAQNRSSGAYGIPQALPGTKMSSYGSDWRSNPATQIRWGLDYIQRRYQTPCGAWGHSQAYNWY